MIMGSCVEIKDKNTSGTEETSTQSSEESSEAYEESSTTTYQTDLVEETVETTVQETLIQNTDPMEPIYTTEPTHATETVPSESEEVPSIEEPTESRPEDEDTAVWGEDETPPDRS